MGTGAMAKTFGRRGGNVIKFPGKRSAHTGIDYQWGFGPAGLFLPIQKAAIDVLCVGSAVLLVTTAAVGIAGIFFVVGTLVAFE
jgi:hypothetical protein